MLGFFLPLLVPVDRLDTVPLGVVPENNLQHVTIRYAHFLRYGIHQPLSSGGEPCRHSLRFLFFPHADNMHLFSALPQRMYVKIASRLHIVKQIRYNTSNYNSRMSLVTGARAIVGLPRNGQQPAPGESLSPLFGGFILRCF